MLQLNELSLVKDQMILSKVSCSLESGKITAFLGESGSGKSSLLRCLSQLETGYEGEILFQGHCLKRVPRQERTDIVGYLSQSYSLFPHMSVLDNCTLAAKGQEEKAKELLTALKMDTYMDKLPKQLSGGQRQRVALVRTLMLEPQFLLLDEPTSALDQANTERLKELLRDLANSGTGVIIATQDAALMEGFFDEEKVFEKGRLL